ncbi:MAG TPA: F0F1 ATP synthase subunit gamma [Caulobacteraceae bacterium]|nr:F0F1 ATP synthase subunit gamma [Caulobacteraceae bacterium]
MASVKEMRTRIRSVQATQKITRALQMVAAAKLRRTQDAAQSARPYAARMAAVIANLAAAVTGPGAPRLLAGTGSSARELVVVATHDRGLAGGFNSSIVRAAREHLASAVSQGRQVSLLTIGRKARVQLQRLYGDRSIGALEHGAKPTLARAQAAADIILQRFEAGEADVVTLFYSHFRSVVSQVPTRQRLIPAELAVAGGGVDLKGAAYEYEPDEETILATLLPRNITVQLFSAMLENEAGFYAAQMAAMDNATRNAGEMIAGLTLVMNRTRQAQITKELIEIISGAEAL